MAYVRVLPVAAGDAPAITEYNQLAENMEAIHVIAQMASTPTYTEHSVLIGASDGTITEVVLAAGGLLIGTSGAPISFAPGSEGQILSSTGGTPVWTTPSLVDFSEADRWGV